MKVYTAPCFNLFRTIIINLLLLVFVISCNNSSVTNKNAVFKTPADSLQLFISISANNSLSITKRQKALKKAYRATQNIKEDTLRLKHLTKIQWIYGIIEDSLQFRKINKQTNTLARLLNDSLRLGITYWDLGEFLDGIGIKDSAYYNLSKAQELFISLNKNRRAGIISYDIAKIQSNIKDYTGSEINTIKAINLLKAQNDDLMLANCYNLLGTIAKDLEEYDRSFLHYERAKDYLKKIGKNIRLESDINNNIGVSYLEKGDTKNAVTYFKKVLNQDSIFYKDSYLYAMTLNNLARSQYRANSNADVIKLFQQSLKIRDSIGDIAGLAGGYFSLAEYYLFKKDSVKALQSLIKSKENAEISHNNSRLLESLKLLTQLDPKNAALYSQRYFTLNDSLTHEENILRNKFARIRFETDEIIAKNRLLEREKQLWTGITVSILLLFTAIYIIISQRIKNQRLKFQQKQQISDEKIFNLMLSEKQKLEEGKKIEQKRISEELHDAILGKMLGSRMLLTGLNKKTDTTAITERAGAIAALKDVEDQIRTISHELSHTAYTDIDNFIRSISDLLKNTTATTSINHIFNYTNEIAWDNLNSDIKINLYRIIQESLQNAIKHSKCTTISLDFAAQNNTLQVLIQDNGIGFDQNKTKKKGIGMLNIQSRINKLNGEFKIDSKKGEGTAIRLSIPIAYFSKEIHNFTLPNQLAET